ncbi:MAG: hypothetical protein K9L59_15720 [Desulfobacterales bacterium]|nr:hypothetical protein [Desulfobacterales bacterium]
MDLLHVSAKVEDRIEQLKKSGKSGKSLAQRAQSIIESLASGTAGSTGGAVGSFTKYGEKRIKNCRKFDLGCGYRLITLQRGQTLFIPILGTHDECQRWLDDHSRLKAYDAGKGTVFQLARVQQQTNISAVISSAARDASEDEECDEKITDRQLRVVFRGLVQAAENRSS